MPASWNADAFEAELTNFPNPAMKDWLLDGLRNGFDTLAVSDVGILDYANSKSADEFSSHDDKWVEGEVANGRYVVIDPSDHPGIVVSPLGTAEKRSYDGSRKRRVTCNESRSSAGRPSLNDSVDKSEIPVELIGIQDVVDPALKFGTSAVFFKLDLKDAFRQLSKRREVHHLHCIRWGGGVAFLRI